MCEVCLCSVLQLCVVLPFSSIPTPDWERKLRGLSPLTSEKERGRPRTRWVARLLALKHVKWVQVSLWCLCSKSCNLQFIRSPTLILGWDAGVKWHCPSYCVNFGRGGGATNCIGWSRQLTSEHLPLAVIMCHLSLSVSASADPPAAAWGQKEHCVTLPGIRYILL